MAITLDDTDIAIIALLQRDGRMSSRAIAGQVGLTDRAVRYRIDRLLRNHIIFIGAVVSATAVGYPVAADIVVDVMPAQIADVAEDIAKLDLISYVATSARDGQISAQAYARDEQELMELVRSLARDYQGVTRVHTTLLPRLIKDITSWPAPRGD
jgi:Lrp/AsnC family transcriptional regulator, regulator for asnA, asnC and gidA